MEKHASEVEQGQAEALGVIETKGLAGLLEAGNAMCWSGGIKLIAYEKIGGAYVALLVRGPAKAVHQAVEAGAKMAERVGELISVHVMDGPHPALLDLVTAQVSTPRS